MAHDAPVNTVPTDAAGTLQPVPRVVIVFDVTDLARTTAFYADVLSFRVVRTERAGMAYETNMLQSERYPGVLLCARQTFQRPVVGTLVGGVVQVGVYEPALATRAKELQARPEALTWILPYSEGARRASFLDPDGYIIELFC